MSKNDMPKRLVDVFLRGTLLDIRVGRIRSDYDAELHGDEISFLDHNLPLFEDIEGKTISDDIRDSGNIQLFGFDEPFDGYAVNLNHYSTSQMTNVQKNGIFEEGKNVFTDFIEEWFIKNIYDSKPLANAIKSLIKDSFGYAFDATDIQDECLDKLDKIGYEIEFDGAESLYAPADVITGGVFFEFNVFNDIPCRLASDLTIVFDGENDESLGDWDDYREEENRFVVLLKEK